MGLSEWDRKDGDTSMRSNAKSSTKKKPGKTATSVVSDSCQKMQAVIKEKTSHEKAGKSESCKIQSQSTIAQDSDSYDVANEIGHNELYTLRYDINDRGIGKILLPPSLSTLLQSDRVAISPAAGGLFIRSL